MYAAVDALLVRAARQAAGVELPPLPDLTSAAPNAVELWRDWLRQVWSQESFAEAVALASPVLADQVSRACAEQCDDARRMRRTVMSVARYLLRMTGRSTPFGLFAGVATAGFGPQPAARWGRRHRAVVRADAEWLAAVVTVLEECPALVGGLPVVVNNLCTVRGDRLVLPLQERTAENQRGADQAVLIDVSVRRTRAVDATVRYAREPIVLSDLVGKLAADFPTTPTAVIQGRLIELVRLRMLLTSLRPPMTATDGLGHVLAQLCDVGAEAVPPVAGRVRALRAVEDAIARHNRTADAGLQRDQRVRLAEQMRLVNGRVEQAMMVDLRLDLDVTLPESVARDAAAAAAALTRLTPYPHGLPGWREYHGGFLERYGVGAVVPLLDLLDPDTGPGYPATYRGSERTEPTAPVSDRDRRLLTLVQTATMAGRDEIALDDPTITALGGDAVGVQAPPHVELFVQVHADSGTALLRGEFTLVVTGAARAAGATTGRFLDLLDEHHQQRLGAAYARVATARAGATLAQLSCPPLRARSQNVARARAVLPRVISVGEYREPTADALRLPDLAVGGDVDGLYLLSLTSRQLIEPTALNAVEFRHVSQPLARFLCEVVRARTAVYMPFSWGAAGCLPFLPRLRYGRIVLAPARWNVSAADLPDRGASWPRWRDGLAAWRRRFRAPAQVYLVETDNLLPLDLDQDPHLVLLRSHLDRYGAARLDEAPPAGGYEWIGGHTHEIVVPLTATAQPRPAPAHLAGVRPVDREDGHLPGASPWLFAKLYGSTVRQTELLTELAAHLSGSNPVVEWWYVPYCDPEPHLRVRVRLPSADDYGPAVRRLGVWSAGMRRQRLLGRLQLDTYGPETGRYGHGEAMVAAERIFAADSAATLAQRQLAESSGVDAQAVAVASLVELTAAFTGDTATGMRWLVDQLRREPATVDRALHAAATRLADPRDDWAALRAVLGSEAVLATWRQRRTVLADYRRLVAGQRDPMLVLPSLLHMHHTRMFGIDPDRERVGRRLAQAAAQRWIATSPAAGP